MISIITAVPSGLGVVQAQEVVLWSNPTGRSLRGLCPWEQPAAHLLHILSLLSHTHACQALVVGLPRP